MKNKLTRIVVARFTYTENPGQPCIQSREELPRKSSSEAPTVFGRQYWAVTAESGRTQLPLLLNIEEGPRAHTC